ARTEVVVAGRFDEHAFEGLARRADDAVGEVYCGRHADRRGHERHLAGVGGGDLGLATVLASDTGDRDEVADGDGGVGLVEVDEDAIGCAGDAGGGGGLDEQTTEVAHAAVIGGDHTLDGDRL